ncbi:uncharacterized protein FIBRA_05091 [Fibroporia radiculosa]|uniref:Citrate transporter-like domain-containing protein n=1 Tax=Fibroporia radiculosa TaxID=599839 RepID=J4IAI6_9APHY|nr:uncharacterized protein FIBRA_05091 [Fibroporia radiculosa]CCM02976.1 predicted protein [Fibroporia radiculosa]
MASGINVGDWRAILVLVFFLFSNAAVIFPVRIPVPHTILSKARAALVALGIVTPRTEPLKRAFFPLNFISAPLLSVLVLLASGAINGAVVRDGIVGANGVKPLDIMALFISLAYLSISLDATGLLRFLAFWVVQKGGSSGRKLFTSLYAFFLVCGVIVGNDPVILSGTAFLAYLTRVSGIVNPTAWIFSQFAAANMASVVLVSSNPTNLVLSGAFSLSFTTYTAHCILPFLGAAISVYPILILGLFRSRDLIPRSINLDPTVVDDMGDTLVDKKGAIFGSALLLVTLSVLVGTSTIGVPVWEVTVPPAVVMLLRDTHHDWARRSRILRNGVQTPQAVHGGTDRTKFDGPVILRGEIEVENLSVPFVSRSYSVQEEQGRAPMTLSTIATKYTHRFSTTFPTVTAVARRLPISLLPFAFLMFILVQGLSTQGWVEVLAQWWAAWVDKIGVLGAIGGMGFIACIFCNVCGTNIGATILLARVIQVWISGGTGESLNPRSREGAIYALALGSNYGAITLTFSASLAGLLWRRILQQKGIHVRPMQFLRINFLIALTAMLVSSAVLVGQVYVIYRNN